MLVIRNSECKGKEKALEKVKRVYEKAKPLGGNKVKKAPSFRAQSRDPLRRSSSTLVKYPPRTVIQSVAWNLLERLTPNVWYEKSELKK